MATNGAVQKGKEDPTEKRGKAVKKETQKNDPMPILQQLFGLTDRPQDGGTNDVARARGYAIRKDGAPRQPTPQELINERAIARHDRDMARAAAREQFKAEHEGRDERAQAIHVRAQQHLEGIKKRNESYHKRIQDGDFTNANRANQADFDALGSAFVVKQTAKLGADKSPVIGEDGKVVMENSAQARATADFEKADKATLDAINKWASVNYDGGKFDQSRLPANLFTFDDKGNRVLDTSKIKTQDQLKLVQAVTNAFDTEQRNAAGEAKLAWNRKNAAGIAERAAQQELVGRQLMEKYGMQTQGVSSNDIQRTGRMLQQLQAADAIKGMDSDGLPVTPNDRAKALGTLGISPNSSITAADLMSGNFGNPKGVGATGLQVTDAVRQAYETGKANNQYAEKNPLTPTSVTTQQPTTQTEQAKPRQQPVAQTEQAKPREKKEEKEV